MGLYSKVWLYKSVNNSYYRKINEKLKEVFGRHSFRVIYVEEDIFPILNNQEEMRKLHIRQNISICLKYVSFWNYNSPSYIDIIGKATLPAGAEQEVIIKNILKQNELDTPRQEIGIATFCAYISSRNLEILKSTKAVDSEDILMLEEFILNANPDEFIRDIWNTIKYRITDYIRIPVLYITIKSTREFPEIIFLFSQYKNIANVPKTRILAELNFPNDLYLYISIPNKPEFGPDVGVYYIFGEYPDFLDNEKIRKLDEISGDIIKHFKNGNLPYIKLIYL
ncbi:MAG: hypothetical protein ACTSRZ_09380 [Promethearchaeota archaeon]